MVYMFMEPLAKIMKDYFLLGFWNIKETFHFIILKTLCQGHF